MFKSTSIFHRISEWRQRSDIVFVAPKVGDLNQNILGFTCPSGSMEDFNAYGDDLEYRVQLNGQLVVRIKKS